MAVPAHDERDFEFARKYDLPITKVIASKKENEEYMRLDRELDEENPDDSILSRLSEIEDILQEDKPMIEDGFLVKVNGHDEQFLDSVLSLPSEQARNILIEKAEKDGFGHRKINYKLRDWLFSRQRYWGEPIPLIHISHEDYVHLSREKSS